MELNEILEGVKELMESKVYLDTHSTKQYTLFSEDIIGDTNGDKLREALQRQFRLITCEEDYKFLDKIMSHSGFGFSTFTKRNGSHVPSISAYGWEVFKQDNGVGRWEVEIDPLRCTYIVDGDDRRRKCLWKNLWRNVKIL